MSSSVMTRNQLKTGEEVNTETSRSNPRNVVLNTPQSALRYGMWEPLTFVPEGAVIHYLRRSVRHETQLASLHSVKCIKWYPMAVSACSEIAHSINDPMP